MFNKLYIRFNSTLTPEGNQVPNNQIDIYINSVYKSTTVRNSINDFLINNENNFSIQEDIFENICKK